MLKENENSILNALEKDLGAIKNFHWFTELAIIYVFLFSILIREILKLIVIIYINGHNLIM